MLNGLVYLVIIDDIKPALKPSILRSVKYKLRLFDLSERI
jgi:hypothetical protein